MSIITKTSDIEEIKEDVDYLKSTQTDIIALDQRVDVLEARPYPESLRDLADVQISPLISDDGKVVSYDALLDKFVLTPDAEGIGDCPSDGQRYV